MGEGRPTPALTGIPVDYIAERPVVPSGTAERLRANFDALETSQHLVDEGRHASIAEQMRLARWSSWGALPGVFEEWRDEYQADRERLRRLVGEDGYRKASTTTLNAHYTAPHVVRAMWDALDSAGFSGGPVLEPGCGSGNFIGLAPKDARVTGVELDPATARIASQLYPSAQLLSGGFEDTRLPEGGFNLTIGNVPFGDFPVHDRRHNAAKLSIHNYFITKSLRLTTPGGFVAVVTSTWTMDSQGERARREIAKYGDLVAAVRLPHNTFRAVAGTDVATDVLVFRRRKAGETPDEARIDRWVRSSTLPVTGPDGEPVEIAIGGAFAENPDRILGEAVASTDRFGKPALQIEPPSGALGHLMIEQLSEQLAQAAREGLDYSPEPAAEVAHSPGLHVLAPAGESEAVVGHVRAVGAGFERFTADGSWTPVKVQKAFAAETSQLLAIRDAAREVISVQRQGLSDAERDAARATLNRLYDSYAREHGPINRYELVGLAPSAKARQAGLDRLEREWRASLPVDGEVPPDDVPVPAELAEAWLAEAKEVAPVKRQKHLAALATDPGRGLVLSLERFDEQTQRAQKGAVFTRDIVASRVRPATAADPADALAISLDESRAVDLERIGSLLGVDADEARAILGELVFDDPGTGTLIPATVYLSGNVRVKLDAARAAAAQDTRFTPNVEALESAVPETVTAMDIIAKPGVRYVAGRDYEDFITEKFGIAATVSSSPVDGTWEVRTPRTPSFSPEVRFRYATKDRTPLKLLEAAMNNRTIVIQRTVVDSDGNEKKVKDNKAILEAREKQARIVSDFGTWLWEDAGRAERIVDAYNRMFNAHVDADFGAAGTALALPGLDPDIKPHPYQRTAVARILADPTVLLDHVVGAGKTGTMTMAAMELRRTGIASKPAIVVPNHLVEQTQREFLAWYPSANVLAIPTGVEAKDRGFWVSAAATGDWDAVIMPQGVFAKIGVDSARAQEWIREETQELRGQLAGTDREEKTRVKAIERAIKRLEARHAAIVTGKDAGMTFEDTGIDYLFIDEAHMYKNLFRASDAYELACAGSARASDLLYKLRALRETKVEEARRAGYLTDGYLPAVATFATGTPVANNMAEMWVMNRYLRPDLLELAQITDINAWAVQFTERSTVLRISPAGTGYDQVERINKYVNLPELLDMASHYTDTVTRENLTVPLPQVAGGQRQLLQRDPSPDVVEYVQDLGERAKNLPPDPREDNMPMIVNDGRMVALDPRLKDLPADPDGGRPAQVADQVWTVHEATASTIFLDEFGEPHPTPGGLQILFSDRAVPNADGRFSMYDAIREELVARGMEASQIAFIHEAPTDEARADLFRRCRDGRVNVIIGSTEKMGTGTNIQDRVVALHHVDVPWRPADLEQREGRAIRQGNQNTELSVFAYGTRGTFDVYMWDLIARKASFIHDVRNRPDGRTIEDGMGELELTAAQVAAALADDPRLEELAGMQMQQSRLQSLHRSFQDERARTRRELGIARSDLADIGTALPLLHGVADSHTAPARYAIGDRAFHVPPSGPGDVGLAFQARIRAQVIAVPDGSGPYGLLGSVNGVRIEARYASNKLHLRMGGTDQLAFTIPWDQATAGSDVGLGRRIANLYENAAATARFLEERKEAHERRVPELEAVLGEPFEHAEALSALDGQIRDLMNDMGLADTAEDAPGVEADSMVSGEVLPAVFGRDALTVPQLRDGDIVTGVDRKAGTLFRVERDGDRARLHELGDSDGPDTEPMVLVGYQRVDLVSRDRAAMTPFERAAVAAFSTGEDLIEPNGWAVRKDERITLQAATEQGGPVRTFTGKAITGRGVEGVVDDDGVRHMFYTGRDAPAGAVIRHGARAARDAAEQAAPKHTQFSIGDVLLEDAEGVGRAGDVLRQSISGYGLEFVDPDTGNTTGKRQSVNGTVAHQPGRYLTKAETEALFPDGLAQTMDGLRPGDLISAHLVDRKQARKDNATVTGVSRGTMVDVYYAFEDGESGKARRREDQAVTVHARKYAALTLLEAARLQDPSVGAHQATELVGLPEGTWVHLNASPGTRYSQADAKAFFARLITAEHRRGPDPRGPGQVIMTLEDPDGTRKVWTTRQPYDTVLAWSELPENPLFLSGVDTGSLPVAIAEPPAAPADAEAVLEPGRPALAEAPDVDDSPAPETGGATAHQPATGTESLSLPVLRHGAAGTAVTNTDRSDTVFSQLLKDAGFKWSSRSQLWYLNSTWKAHTRDAKASQLINAAKEADRMIAHEDPDGGRRKALVRSGMWVRLDAADAKAGIVVPGSGSEGITFSYPRMYAMVLDRTGNDLVVRTRLGETDRTLRVRLVEDVVPCVDDEEALAWIRQIAPSLGAESGKIDRTAGRAVDELVAGQEVRLDVRPLSLASVKGAFSWRRLAGRVLANLPGGSANERYLLLENGQKRAWFTAPPRAFAEVTGQAALPDGKYVAPKFTVQPASAVQPGTAVTIEGLNAADGQRDARVREIVTVTGTLESVSTDAEGKQLAVVTGDSGEKFHVSSLYGKLEAYTFTPGTLRAKTPERSEPGSTGTTLEAEQDYGPSM